MSLSLWLLLLLLTFSLFSSVNSNSYDKKSVASICPPHDCGNITIKYPFWRQDVTPTSNQYCGYRGLGLNCTAQNKTILFLQNYAYNVKSINYTDYTLTLVDVEVSTNQTCPRARHNLTIDNLPLYYSRLDLNLSFYFNCRSSYPPPHGGVLIECLGLDVNRSYVYVVGSEPDEYEYWYEYCEEKVVATVIGREINYSMYDLIGWFVGAMNEGFILTWGQMEECDECEASDGACGFDQRTQNFLCFCPGGNVNTKHCKEVFPLKCF